MFTRVALGVDWDGGALNLVALGRRFGRFVVVGTLRVPDAASPTAANVVSKFIKRYHLREARVIASLPREALLVRFLDLPAEAEPQLGQVVGYQIEGLHPFPKGQVSWDCAIVGRRGDKKQLRVMVVIIEKSRLAEYLNALKALGLRASSLTLSAACLSLLLQGQGVIPEGSLVICGRESGLELVGFDKDGLSVTRDVAVGSDSSAADQLARELHGVRAFLGVEDSAAIRLFACGSMPPIYSPLVSDAAPLPQPKLRMAQRAPLDLGAPLLALAAAYAGLVRKPAVYINLLPADEQWHPRRFVRSPIYGLEATAGLLALLVLAHGPIENVFYARALDLEIKRLRPRAEAVRRQEQQADALAARAQTLESLRRESWRKLEILRELTRLLPDGTWVQEVHVGDGTVEIFGTSTRAADLVRPLENSPYFSQVEFTSPITRDAQNKEIFQMRMRLKQSPRL
ncbi:MAG TPA: type II secretion system protein GspL [Terriglobia bacterium]|nr:type II secretion system protein GspL [Terriglobia bacterium]